MFLRYSALICLLATTTITTMQKTLEDYLMLQKSLREKGDYLAALQLNSEIQLQRDKEQNDKSKELERIRKEASDLHEVKVAALLKSMEEPQANHTEILNKICKLNENMFNLEYLKNN